MKAIKLVNSGIILWCMFFLSITMTTSTQAEEKFGIAVYPNAKSDAVTKNYETLYAKQLQNMHRSAPQGIAAYRTSDDFKKVAEFYKGQKKLMAFDVKDNTPQKSAMFCLDGMKCASLGKGLDVALFSPWGDDKESHQDVLILFVQTNK